MRFELIVEFTNGEIAHIPVLKENPGEQLLTILGWKDVTNVHVAKFNVSSSIYASASLPIINFVTPLDCAQVAAACTAVEYVLQFSEVKVLEVSTPHKTSLNPALIAEATAALVRSTPSLSP